jgi:hypothetical protein
MIHLLLVLTSLAQQAPEDTACPPGAAGDQKEFEDVEYLVYASRAGC